MRPLAILTITLSTLIANSLAADTNVSGTISTNMTWTVGGSPYVAIAAVTVASVVTQ